MTPFGNPAIPAPQPDQPDTITYFSETDARGQRTRFGIKDEDRTRHMYIIGQTGMGKSVLLENMAVQDIRNGNGFCFIDPHGSVIETLLDYIPEDRINDVVHLAPFDLEYPISFNVMEDVGVDKRHLVAQGLLSAFKKIWGEDTFSARMEHIINNTLLALLEYPNTTILSMTRMLTERAYRDKVVEHLKEPSVKAFWINEFGTWDERYQKEAAAGVLNKVSQFVSNPLIRNIVGQPKSSFDFREAMDKRKIILINLSKGQVGEENSKLLGAMLTTKVYLAAMSRADVTKSELAKLPYFYLYVDEFQTVVNDSFESILSEARKYKLSLIIAHQYIEQMPELVRAAVFGNVGTKIVFRVGATDGEFIEKEFGEEFTTKDIVSLSRFQIYLILMIDGVGSQPFSARTLPPIPLPERSYKEEVIASSRKNYAGNRDKIEADIVAWMFDSADATAKNREKNRKKKQRKKENAYHKARGTYVPRDGAQPQQPNNNNKPKTPATDTPPGDRNFKDAFAAALKENKVVVDPKPTVENKSPNKPQAQTSPSQDKKTYSVGQSMKLRKGESIDEAQTPNNAAPAKDSKFAFSYDESQPAKPQDKQKQQTPHKPQQPNKQTKPKDSNPDLEDLLKGFAK